MTTARLPDSVPDPVRPPRGLRLPRALWPGRMLFFALGLGSTGVAAVVFLVLYATRGDPVPADVAFALPLLPAAYFCYRAHRDGPHWRWRSYALGAMSAFFFGALVLRIAAPPAGTTTRPLPAFDTVAWQDAGAEPTIDRTAMAAEFLVYQRPFGRPIASIDAMLGPDDPALRKGRGRPASDWDRAWRIAPHAYL